MRLVRMILWLAAALSAGTAGPLSAQQAGAVLVMEVPVEIRTLSPDVAQAFLECSIRGGGGTVGSSLASGVARAELNLTVTSTGGEVSEVSRVLFTRDLMKGEPVGITFYACQVILRTPTGEEAVAVEGSTAGQVLSSHFIQTNGPAPPAWSEMLSYSGLLGGITWAPLHLDGIFDAAIGVAIWEAWSGCTFDGAVTAEMNYQRCGAEGAPIR